VSTWGGCGMRARIHEDGRSVRILARKSCLRDLGSNFPAVGAAGAGRRSGRIARLTRDARLREAGVAERAPCEWLDAYTTKIISSEIRDAGSILFLLRFCKGHFISAVVHDRVCII
jgi:hypothetical protein